MKPHLRWSSSGRYFILITKFVSCSWNGILWSHVEMRDPAKKRSKRERDREKRQISKLKWFDHICAWFFHCRRRSSSSPLLWRMLNSYRNAACHYIVAFVGSMVIIYNEKRYFELKYALGRFFSLSFTEAHQWATTFSFYIFIIVSSSAHQAAAAKAITVASRLVFLLEFSFLCHPFVLMCSRAMQHSCSVYCCCAWFFLSFLSFFCSFTSLFIFILHLRLFHPSSSSSSSSFGRFDEPLFQRVPLSMDKNLALLEWRCVQAFLCMCFYVVLSPCLCTISYVLYIL